MFTPGRYYYCPENTPFYPGEHFYGSRVWTSDERDPLPLLGEYDLKGYHWNNGQAPVPLPDPILLGEETCIAEGEGGELFSQWFETLEGGVVVTYNPFPRVEFEDTILCGGGNNSEQKAHVEACLYLDEPRDLSVVIDSITNDNSFLCQQAEVAIDHVVVASIDNRLVGDSCLPVPLADDGGTTTLAAGLHHLSFDAAAHWLGHVKGCWFELRFTLTPELKQSARVGGTFDSRCYTVPELAPFPPDIMVKADRLFFAGVLLLQYTDQTQADFLFRGRLGSSWTYRTDANDPARSTPGTMIATRPDCTICVVSGTTTFEQLCMQGFDSLAGPLNFGAFGTSQTWWDATFALFLRLTAAGADLTKKFILVGHSYGGAVASVMAGRLRTANPDRPVDLCCFGTPKPGDERLQDLLDGCRRVFYANAGDPVPNVPPSAQELAYMTLLVPLPVRLGWSLWIRATGQKVVLVDGTEFDSQQSTIDDVELLVYVSNALLGIPNLLPFPHTMVEYVRRLGLEP